MSVWQDIKDFLKGLREIYGPINAETLWLNELHIASLWNKAYKRYLKRVMDSQFSVDYKKRVLLWIHRRQFKAQQRLIRAGDNYVNILRNGEPLAKSRLDFS